jgi:hypothetical protein
MTFGRRKKEILLKILLFAIFSTFYIWFFSEKTVKVAVLICVPANDAVLEHDHKISLAKFEGKHVELHAQYFPVTKEALCQGLEARKHVQIARESSDIIILQKVSEFLEYQVLFKEDFDFSCFGNGLLNSFHDGDNGLLIYSKYFGSSNNI